MAMRDRSAGLPTARRLLEIVTAVFTSFSGSGTSSKSAVSPRRRPRHYDRCLATSARRNRSRGMTMMTGLSLEDLFTELRRRKWTLYLFGRPDAPDLYAATFRWPTCANVLIIRDEHGATAYRTPSFPGDGRLPPVGGLLAVRRGPAVDPAGRAHDRSARPRRRPLPSSCPRIGLRGSPRTRSAGHDPTSRPHPRPHAEHDVAIAKRRSRA